MRKLHGLKLAAEVLQERVTDLSSRSTSRTTSDTLHKSDEAQRKARALREIEADRQLVKDRVERERIVREVREKARMEAEQAERERELAEELEASAGGGGRGGGEGTLGKEDGRMEMGMQVDGGEYVPDEMMRGGRSLGNGVAPGGATVNHGQGVGMGTGEAGEDEDEVEEEPAGPGDYRPRHRGHTSSGKYFRGKGQALGKKEMDVKQEIKEEVKEE